MPHTRPARVRLRAGAPVSLLAAAGLAGLAGLPGHAAADSAPIVVIAAAGSQVPGVGTILSIRDAAVGDDGSWYVHVRTDFGNGARDEVILRNGIVWIREGDPLPGDPDVVAAILDDIAVAPDGRAWTTLESATGAGASGPALVVDGVPSIRAGDLAAFSPLPAETIWTDLLAALPRDGGRSVVRGTVDDGQVLRDVLVETFVLGGEPVSTSARLIEGRSVAGVGTVGRIPATGTEGIGVSRQGAIVTSVDLAGEPSGQDGLLVYRPASGGDWIALAREGEASPIAGRNWSGLIGRSVGVNDDGIWAVQGTLSGSSSSNQVLVRNGVVFRQEGDAIEIGGGSFTLQSFGLGPLRLLPDGRMVWLGDWNAPAGSDRAIFLEDEAIILAGTTEVDGVSIGGGEVDGVLVADLELTTDNWTISPNGAWLVARVTLRDPASGADIDAVVRALLLGPCAADVSGNGDVDFDDLLSVLVHLGGADGPTDIDGDGDTDFADILIVLATWGPC